MKIFKITLAMLLSAVPSLATMEMMQAAKDVMDASDNLDKAVAAMMEETESIQPKCAHPTDNYVKCISYPDDVENTNILKHPVIPRKTALAELKGTPDYDMALGMITAFREASEGCKEDTKFTLATYPWLSKEDFSSPVMVQSLVTNFVRGIELRGAQVSLWNTFSDDHATGGAQVVYDYGTAATGRDLEFPDFPMNMPPMEGGFYDIDFGQARITYTLKDNRSATNIVFPEGTFDRYYFVLPAKAISVQIEETDKIVAKVSVLEPNTAVETVDAFGTGLVFPEKFGNNIILVEIVGGTDLSELGQQLIITYTMQDHETIICGSNPLSESALKVMN